MTTTIEEFDSIRGLARLAFGPEHEVSRLVAEVIAAIQQVADRGVISTGDHPSPRDYVDRTFLPLSSDLFEALAETCGLRDDSERLGRSEVHATDNLPAGGH